MFSTHNHPLSFPPPHSLVATITPVTPTTPAVRTRSQKSRYRLHSPLKQHRLSNGNKGIFHTTLNLNSQPATTATSTAPPSAFKVPASTFTFSVAPSTNTSTNTSVSKNKATLTTPAMPPKLSSKTRPQLVKKGTSKSSSSSTKASSSKSQANASSNGPSGPKLTLDHMFAAQSGNKRALSPTAILGNDVTPSKRFKNEVIALFSRPSPLVFVFALTIWFCLSDLVLLLCLFHTSFF